MIFSVFLNERIDLVLWIFGEQQGEELSVLIKDVSVSGKKEASGKVGNVDHLKPMLDFL